MSPGIPTLSPGSAPRVFVHVDFRSGYSIRGVVALGQFFAAHELREGGVRSLLGAKRLGKTRARTHREPERNPQDGFHGAEAPGLVKWLVLIF